MSTIIFTKGLQCSGKSTWAKQYVKENQDFKRVCRDDLRHMLSSYTFNKENEKLVTVIERSIIYPLLSEGYNLIVDKMNLNEKAYEDDKNFIFRVCDINGIKDCVIEVKEFPIALDEAIKRDKNRDFSVGEKVIQSTWSKYQEVLIKMLNIPKPEYDETLEDAVICDIDGTLADRGSRNAFDFKRVKEDTVKKDIKQLFDLLSVGSYHRPVRKIIFSGRDDSCYDDTVQWLRDHGIYFTSLYMRQTGDKRKDSIVKKELYENHIKGKYNVLYVIDDRRQVIDMWRNELGLTVLDIAGHNF